MKPLHDNIGISIQELFAVLLPGAVLMMFLQMFDFSVLTYQLTSKYPKGDFIIGTAFFAASYFLGYLIYVLSSWLDGFYDRIKRILLKVDTWKKGTIFLKKVAYFIFPSRFGAGSIQSGDLKDAREPIPGFVTGIIFPFLWDTHQLIRAVVVFKNRDIGNKWDSPAHQIIDAYQYSFRRLMKEEPAMFIDAERYYATARFFRSMTLVWFIGAIIWLFRSPENWPYTLLFLSLSIVSFFAFLNRWLKANHMALKNIIIIEGIKNPVGMEEIVSEVMDAPKPFSSPANTSDDQ